MSSYAILGASRGIGLEFARQLAARSDTTVFAIVRSASASRYLAEVASGRQHVHIIEADVADYQSLERAAKEVANVTGGKLDCLIHNAARTDLGGINKGYNDFETMEALDADLIDAYKVNTLGVIHGIAAFLPLLRASKAPVKKVAVIGSPAGDPKFVRAVGAAGMAAYGITKAAALVATTKYALTLKDEGFAVISLSPGVVDVLETAGVEEARREGAHAGLQQLVDVFAAAGYPMKVQSPEQSVAAQLKVVDGLTTAQNGAFLTETGAEWGV
ncbi:NAD-P-binding protein [Earliella scabrosa]|nr:NAD-P-binding protein [Earliella scabrosa]